METQIPEIGFALTKVTTEQFALIEGGFSETGSITIGTSLRFGSDYRQKMITCFSAFTFESDKKPFITIEAGCHFEIAEAAWSQMLDKKSNSLRVPRQLLTHLAMLTVGTTRGILHAKTENTNFKKYFLPTINVSALIKKDLLFKFNMKEVKKGKRKNQISK